MDSQNKIDKQNLFTKILIRWVTSSFKNLVMNKNQGEEIELQKQCE